MLERARKEVEIATGLNRELSSAKPEMAVEVRIVGVEGAGYGGELIYGARSKQ